MKFWKDLGSSEGQEGDWGLLLIFFFRVSFLPHLCILLQGRPMNCCGLGNHGPPVGVSRLISCSWLWARLTHGPVVLRS